MSDIGLAPKNPVSIQSPPIESRVLIVRQQRVLIDADLAMIFGVPTKRLNEQVKRNAERFPADFMFPLNAQEKAEVVANCDHLKQLKFSKALPLAFTEYGAIQAANVLNSPRAIEMGIFVVRAFIKLRELAASHHDLAKRLDELEAKTEAQALKHDSFASITRKQLKDMLNALRQIMTPPDPPKRPIGFVIPEDKKTPKASKKIKGGRALKAG